MGTANVKKKLLFLVLYLASVTQGMYPALGVARIGAHICLSSLTRCELDGKIDGKIDRELDDICIL